MKRLFLFLIVGVLVVGMTQNSFAASFKAGDTALTLGGSAQLNTEWCISDFGDVPATQEVDSTNNFDLYVPFDSMLYLGAENGPMSAYIEIGVGTSNPEIRMGYATYDSGDGFSLMVGRNWSIIAEASPTQRLAQDNTLVGFGDLYNGLTDQLRLIYSADKLTMQLAFEKAEAGVEDTTTYVTEAAMPAIAATLTYDDGTVAVTPSIYFQKYTLAANTAGIKDVDITTYALALNAALTTDVMTLSAELWYGSNVSVGIDIYGVLRDAQSTFGFPATNAAGDDIEDVTSMGGWLQASIPVSDCTLVCGLGYQTADVETLPAADYESDVSTFGAFVNYVIPVAEGFSITPEIAYFNYGDAPAKSTTGVAGENGLGSDIYVGVHFQYDF